MSSILAIEITGKFFLQSYPHTFFELSTCEKVIHTISTYVDNLWISMWIVCG